ncbi:hypothetical protein GW17_00000873 [Ensete ventricosum]|nr:hypothetical protein GW17_00000873 [Ensete ventricosum]
MGNRYCAPSTHFRIGGCPLNRRNGSSGKKVSLSRNFILSTVLCGGAASTLCTASIITPVSTCPSPLLLHSPSISLRSLTT